MVTKTREKRLTGAMVLTLLMAFGAAQAAFAASTWLGSVPSEVPTRIALDGQGAVYVTESRGKNVLRVYDRTGKLLRTLSGLQGPGGVHVDGQGRIYIASLTKNSVDVYTSELVYSHSLGAGKNEFKSPHSVVVSSSGLIYVSDAKDNKVKVYNPNGTQAFVFGGWGKGNGQFNSPLGMAINGAGELFVLDWQSVVTPDGETAGARIQVFDPQGNYLRSFGQFGTGEGKMVRPLDIALGQGGRIYVADGYQGVVHVFDSAGNPAETIFDPVHPTKTPIGLAVGKDNQVFIASNNQKNIEIFCMAGCTTMDVTPAKLSFSSVVGAVPAAQSVSIKNSGSGTLEWSAAAAPGWITLTKTDATTLSVNLAGKNLAIGTYSGAVTVTATTGATATVAVELTVNE
ncbi:MAG TPA: NHL repeat-containing protein, partial [Nitrospirota bacterium]|nr:NHL repeat-containing protein [Nitrospirota bacterium]